LRIEVIFAVAGRIVIVRRKLVEGVVDRAVLRLVAESSRRKSLFQRGSSRSLIVVRIRRGFVLWRNRSLCCGLRVECGRI
jgi:hypothetical protein